MSDPAALVHVGLLADQSLLHVAAYAHEQALQRLSANQRASVSALAAIATLEADGRVNAGLGATHRLGRPASADALIMTSDGRFGAVCAIAHVRHPILVAAALHDARDHATLAGDSAQRFAAARGFSSVAEQTAQPRTRAVSLTPPSPDWVTRATADVFSAMSAPTVAAPPITETVGIVCRDRLGQFAAAASTGGHVSAAVGRPTHVAIPGCGVYAGKHGAVIATGTCEKIIEYSVAFDTYELMAEGASAAEAATAMLKKRGGMNLGILAIDHRSQAYVSSMNFVVA